MQPVILLMKNFVVAKHIVGILHHHSTIAFVFVISVMRR